MAYMHVFTTNQFLNVCSEATQQLMKMHTGGKRFSAVYQSFHVSVGADTGLHKILKLRLSVSFRSGQRANKQHKAKRAFKHWLAIVH